MVVIPANAGTQAGNPSDRAWCFGLWIPALAGMTARGGFRRRRKRAGMALRNNLGACVSCTRQLQFSAC